MYGILLEISSKIKLQKHACMLVFSGLITITAAV